MKVWILSVALWATSTIAAVAAPVLGLERLTESISLTPVIDATPLPGSNGGVLLLDLANGRVSILQDGVRRSILGGITLTDAPDQTVSNRSAFSIATAPDFESSGKIYISLAVGIRGGPPGGPVAQHIVVEYTVDLQTLTIDRSTQRRIISIDYPINNPGSHFGGALSFGPDGMLFMTTGDGDLSFGPGAGNPAQDVASKLGKVLRIDVSRDDFAADPHNNYGIPEGNPDLGEGASPEIYALGLRNPFKGKYDAGCDCFLIADVGEMGFEEINILSPGANFGWDAFEAELLIGGELADVGELTQPLFAYGRQTGVSITGGLVYSGDKFENLTGQYIYGDFSGPAGATESPIFSLSFDPEANEVSRQLHYDLEIDQGSLTRLVGFGQSADGDLFLFDLDGDIFEVVSVQVPLPAPFLMLLFALGALTPLSRRSR